MFLYFLIFSNFHFILYFSIYSYFISIFILYFFNFILFLILFSFFIFYFNFFCIFHILSIYLFSFILFLFSFSVISFILYFSIRIQNCHIVYTPLSQLAGQFLHDLDFQTENACHTNHITFRAINQTTHTNTIYPVNILNNMQPNENQSARQSYSTSF